MLKLQLVNMHLHPHTHHNLTTSAVTETRQARKVGALDALRPEVGRRGGTSMCY